MRLVKQAQSVRGGLPLAALFLSRAVKGTKLKDEAIALLSKNPGAILLNTVIHQKQAIADTSCLSVFIDWYEWEKVKGKREKEHKNNLCPSPFPSLTLQ